MIAIREIGVIEFVRVEKQGGIQLVINATLGAPMNPIDPKIEDRAIAAIMSADLREINEDFSKGRTYTLAEWLDDDED